MFFSARNWPMEFKVGTSFTKERLINAIVLHTLHCLGGFYDIMLIRYDVGFVSNCTNSPQDIFLGYLPFSCIVDV